MENETQANQLPPEIDDVMTIAKKVRDEFGGSQEVFEAAMKVYYQAKFRQSYPVSARFQG